MMGHGMYILEGKTPVLVEDTLEWGRQFENSKRVVAQTKLPDGTFVSTVFLGLDHAFGEEEPILFETMIFGGEHDGYQERYHTWDEAERGHQVALDLIHKV